MPNRHCRADMRNDTVKFIEVEFILISLLVALVAKTFQDERCWAVAADLFHATRKALDV